MRVCPYCGSQMGDSDPFCFKCGAEVKDQGTPSQSAPQQQVQPRSYPRQAPPGGGPRTNGIVLMVIITSVVLVMAFIGMTFMSSLIDTPNQESGNEHVMDYSWRYYCSDDAYNTYEYTLKVPNAYYDNMERSTIDRTGTSSDVRFQKTDGTTVFAVKDYIVVDEYVKKVASDLRTMYDADKAASKIPADADLSSFLTAFVQGSITYELDSEYTKNANTEYWKYPLETLCDKRGDCEDTAMLLSALLAASDIEGSTEKYHSGIYLLPEHAMTAVKVGDIPASKSRIGADIRFDYYPIETAIDDYSSFKTYTIGKIAPEHIGDYFHLYVGSSTEYYGVTSS